MALSATATVSGSTATVEIACDAGATVRVQAGIAFVGRWDSGLSRAGDLFMRGSSVPQPGDGVVSGAVDNFINGVRSTGTYSRAWRISAGEPPAFGDYVWRGTDGSAPIIARAFHFFGGSYANFSYPATPFVDPGPGDPGAPDSYDATDKGLTTDVPGALFVAQCEGYADSWAPPVSFYWATPIAPGLGPLATAYLTGGQNGEPGDEGSLCAAASFGLWTHRKPTPGPTGNWGARIRWSNPWNDGHSGWDIRAYALRPAPGVGYGTVGAVPSSGASRQVTVTGLAPETVLTISDGTEVATIRIAGSLAVNEPVNLGDGRWKLSGTRA